jgi:hypothetical protein
MSDEGGVTLSDMVRDTMPLEVTPLAGKEALGKWRTLKENTNRTLCRVKSGNIKSVSSRRSNHSVKGRMRASA